MVVYFVVCLTRSRVWRATAAAAAAALVVGVGFSRLYLGLHFFSDVVGGLAAGAVWLTACVTALEVARQRQDATERGAAARQDPGDAAQRRS